MPLELVPLCTVDLTLADPLIVGEGPSGTRVVAEVAELEVRGERLRGRMRGRASADWVTVIDGRATIDVRGTMETHDGALILVQYRGRSDFSLGPGSKPLYVAPLFETGDERYRWLNDVQAVGKGALEGHNLHYDWYELR